mgnify:FL=1
MNFTYFKTNIWSILSVVSVLFFASCEKDEIPVEPHPPGNVVSQQVEMGYYYPDQIWFNIETGTEVSRNHKTAWDLAFECNDPGWRVTINSANNAYIAQTEETDINAVTDTTGMDWKWDEFSGNLDSTAIGDWRSNPKIYVLDRGKDEVGKHLGVSKLMVDSVTADSFYFKFSDIQGTSWVNASISKDSNYVFSYFSLNSGGQQVTIAPPKTEWDIVFTQYTFAFYDMDPVVPYLVTGVLLNPYHAYSTKCYDQNFADITLNSTSNYSYNQRIDNIGYDWKYYDFDQGYYITLPEKNYIFRSHNGKKYKIHFLDWYNDQGQKGSPTFEFSEL